MKATLTALLSLTLLACGGASASVADLLADPPVGSPDAPKTFVSSEEDASSEPTPATDASAAPGQDAGRDSPAELDASLDATLEAGQDAGPADPARFGVSASGGTQRVEAGYPPGLSGAQDLTFEGWFLVRSLTPNGRLFAALGASCSVAGDPSYGADQGKLNCLARYSTNAATTQRFSLAPLALNVWHHVAWVKQGSSWTLYLDGAEQGKATADFAGMPAPEASSRVSFGGTGRADESLDGVVDEARLSLSADYAAPFAPPAHLAPSGALSLALDEGAGTVVSGGSAQLQGGCAWQAVAR